MKYIYIDTKKDLVIHEKEIANLFKACFGDREINKVWSWAYLENPNGAPLVTLCYDGDVLVGHYGVIPMPLVCKTFQSRSYLSMTTMVAPSHQGLGLFCQLAEATYGMAADCGADFIMGFPNQNSISGFKKRLKWNLPQTDFVASLKKPQLLDLHKRSKLNQFDMLKLDFHDPLVRSWRLSRPGYEYFWESGCAWKRHLNQIDLIWYDENSDLGVLPDKLPVNLLLDASEMEYFEYKEFDYQFGGLGIKNDFIPSKIFRAMAISDVF